MVTEWFRNKHWNDEIEKSFFSHLSRARTQRDQYIVIQALTLAKQYPNVSLMLIDLYFQSKKSSFEDVRALSAKSDAYISLGDIEQAIEAMKAVLAIEREKPSHKTTKYVDFPFLVATLKISREYNSALETLAERAKDLMFPLDIFKYHASNSLIHRELQDFDLSKKHAAIALEAAKIRKSGFRFHQDLGLVGKEYKTVVAELLKIHA